MKKISEAELEIMMTIWESHLPAVTSAYVLEHLTDRTKWKKTSVLTFLSRLVEKGYLDCDKEAKTNRYSPLVTYDQFTKKESKHILEKMYHNSLKNFVSALYDGNGLADSEVAELQEYLNSLK